MKKNSFQHRLEENFTAFKNNIALARGTHTVTYRDLDKKSGYIARWLIDKGMKRGDSVDNSSRGAGPVVDRGSLIYSLAGLLPVALTLNVIPIWI